MDMCCLERSKAGTRRLALLVLPILIVCAATCLAHPLPAHVPDSNVERDAIPDIYKWNLDQLFPSETAWEEALQTLTEEIPGLNAFTGKLDDPESLRKCLDLYFDLHDRVNHVTLFANLEFNMHLDSDHFQNLQARSLSLMDNLMATASFIRSEVLNLDDMTLANAYKAKNGPGEYKIYLDNLRRRKARLLDTDTERVMTLMGDNLWAEIDLNELPSGHENTFGAMMTDLPLPMVHDADGNEVQLTFANYGRFRGSDNRDVRREAVSKFLGTLKQYEHVLASTLAGQYDFTVALARARNYDTALEAYLDKDGLDTGVYNNLIDTINNNLEPLHRYVELRKRALGYDSLHLYDLYIPFVEGVESDVPFEKARTTIIEALKPLGKEYGVMLEEGIDPANGWLDLYPHRGKESGAFSASVYGRHPYVKMNYQDSSDDMSTLAHEYGHALHTQLSMENQSYSSFRYVPFLAEIASTCNEALLSSYLLENSTDANQKAALLVEFLESVRTTIYRQTLFAEFEKTVHGYIEADTPVTAVLLNQTYRDLITRYYGPGFTIDQNDDLEWAYIPHFYYKYYVFTYATGLSCGTALAQLILDQGDEAVDAYLGMLSGGCSKAPLELLKDGGIDLTRPAAIESTLTLFAERITELEKLLFD